MALSQANLTIGVRVDSSKLKVDLATAKAEVRRATADLNRAVRIGDPTAIAASRQALLGATRQFDLLSEATRRNTQAQALNIAATAKSTAGFTALDKAILGVRTRALLATGAVTGAVVGTLKLASSAAESVDNFGDMTKQLGISAEEYGLLKQAMIQAGVPLEEINSILLRFASRLGSAQQDLLRARGEIGKTSEDVTVLGRSLDRTEDAAQTFGETGAILRGGVKATEDSTNAFTKHNISLENSRGKFKTFTEGLITALRTLEKIPDASQRAAAAQDIFSRAFTKLGDVPDQLKALQEQGFKPPVPTPAEQAAADKYIVSYNQMLTTIARTRDIIGGEIGQSLVPFFQQFNVTLQANSGEIKLWVDAQLAALSRWVEGTRKEIEFIKQLWTDAKSWWENFNVGGQFSAAGRPGVNAPASDVVVPVTRALGGYVGGPGTGTSDSILARLSNGEFVINAASVQRLGVGFLQGLNRYAAGGVVGRFAEGGLVAAGGTPVHLHLGNASFPLAGSAGVVKALVSEAHAQQVRSAGVKPSWFAGRPGGR